MSLFFFYFLFQLGTWIDVSKFFATLFAIILLIYSIIGERIKGEGNIFTEDFMVNSKKDVEIINNKQD